MPGEGDSRTMLLLYFSHTRDVILGDIVTMDNIAD